VCSTQTRHENAPNSAAGGFFAAILPPGQWVSPYVPFAVFFSTIKSELLWNCHVWRQTGVWRLWQRFASGASAQYNSQWLLKIYWYQHKKTIKQKRQFRANYLNQTSQIKTGANVLKLSITALRLDDGGGLTSSVVWVYLRDAAGVASAVRTRTNDY